MEEFGESDFSDEENYKKPSKKRRMEEEGVEDETKFGEEVVDEEDIDVEGEVDNSIQHEEDGNTIMAFNLNEEKEEGSFDSSGNFVWKEKERNVQEDAWLEGITKAQMKSAQKAQDAMKHREEKTLSMTTDKARLLISGILQANETVLQALRRLGKKKVKKSYSRKKTAETTIESKQSNEEKQQFNDLTEAADFLMIEGQVDIYQLTRESFVRHVPREDTSKSYFVQDKNTMEEKNNILWEYKGVDGKIYGPFSSQQFLEWKKQGYFTGENSVMVRKMTDKKNKIDQSSTNISANDLANDFDDDDDDDDDKLDLRESETWLSSDRIDFDLYC